MKRRIDLLGALLLLTIIASTWNIYTGIYYSEQRKKDERLQHRTIRTNSTRMATAWLVKESTAHKDMANHRRPTHQACKNIDGIYHIAMTDILGGAGTGLLQLVLNQVDYARRHNLKPWVHMNNSSQVIYDNEIHSQGPGVALKAMRATRAIYVRRLGGHWRDSVPGPPNYTNVEPERDFWFPGTGIWEHYFDPVSDFVPGDKSCHLKLLVSMDLYLITPGLHGFSSYATRCWRYEYLPEYITQPHISYHSWLEKERLRAHELVQQYILFKPYLRDAAQRANPGCNVERPCLGLHIRHSDKAAGRRVIATSEFLPYAVAFVANGGAAIYLATDSSKVVEEIEDAWPAHIRTQIRRMGDGIVRSSDQQAVFDMASHHRTNQEALIEILALSQCQYLVHGLSAMSESSIWINIGLHNRSVNLEDPDHIAPVEFGTLVQMSRRGEPEERWPHPRRTDAWWRRIDDKPSQLLPSTTACDGYDGVLLIAAVSRSSSTGAAFFRDVLNQLLFAEQNNLIPWIHLMNGTELIYDAEAHDSSETYGAVQNAHYTAVQTAPVMEGVCPVVHGGGKTTTRTSQALQGNGIWGSYFKPASTYQSTDPSCSKLPLLSMDEALVRSVLSTQCPYTVKAWRYDAVAESQWKPNDMPLSDWYGTMRQMAHRIVSKHFQFLSHIVRRADLVNPVDGQRPCLGVHIRVGDKKGKYISKVKADAYLPYMEAFERAGGRAIYVASDSHRAIQYLMKTLPDRVARLVTTQGQDVVRTFKEYPTHFIDGHDRVNSETLVDVLALSRCSLLLHSHSTVSEAAIYLNMDLHNNSVNLEHPDRPSPDQFRVRAKRLLI